MSKRELAVEEESDTKCPRSMPVEHVSDAINVLVGRQVFTFDKLQLENRFPEFLEKLKEQQQQSSNSHFVVDGIEPDVFKVFHRYVQNNFRSSDLHYSPGKIYHAAKQFCLKGLLIACIQYMKSHLSRKNVFLVLDHAICTSNNTCRSRCIELLSRELPRVMNSQSFCNLPEDCVLEILQSERTSVAEEKVFYAVLKWAENQCTCRGLEQTNENKRIVMADALKLIQFPRMKSGIFMKKVSRCGILTQDEIIEHLRFFLDRDMNIGFNTAAPNAMEQGENELFTVKRFRSITSGKYYMRDNKDGISFTCDSDVLLHGILLFGSHQRPGRYTVDINIMDDLSGQLHSQNELLTSDGNRRMYEIIIAPCLRITKDRTYTILLLIKGICSYFGKDGIVEVEHGDVNVKFSTSLKGLNGTNVDQGQIPGLILQKT